MKDLKEIVARVLDIPAGQIGDELSNQDSDEWDSFNHLMLVSEIEKELKITFTINEVGQIRTYKDLRLLVEEKLK